MNQGYFVYYTLPLGWEAGAYVYHTTGLLATSCITIPWSSPYSSYFSDCRAGQVMVHKALNLLESRLPPLLVRRLVGLPFWLYSLSLTFVLPEIRSSR